MEGVTRSVVRFGGKIWIYEVCRYCGNPVITTFSLCSWCMKPHGSLPLANIVEKPDGSTELEFQVRRREYTGPVGGEG